MKRLLLKAVLLSCFASVSFAEEVTSSPSASAVIPVTSASPQAATPVKPHHAIKKKHKVTKTKKSTQSLPIPTPDLKISRNPDSPVQERLEHEHKAETNPYSIVFYKPTYVLPFYYTGSPYNSIYQNNTPNGESLKHLEMKYQISFKVPIWKNMFGKPSTLYLGYTQLSYWQAYDHNAFFRETDYEPELFVANEINRHLFKDWHIDFLNFGAVHQSNGFGGTLERSWNRLYLSAVLSNDNWMITFRPWVVLHDGTYQQQNPNLAYWEGYEEIIVAYKFRSDQVISIQSHNAIESQGKRAGTTIAWTFPMTRYIKGNLQFFTGYGQSLIEYNHHTNSIGIGIALSNWV